MNSFPSEHPLIVHSHVRWDFVWHRPQQLFSRFARTRDVLFVEEPVFLDDAARATLDLTSPQPRLTRAIPRLPSACRDSETVTQMTVRALLLEAIGSTGPLHGRFDEPVLWFHTPTAGAVMIGAFDEVAVVYDCLEDTAPLRSTSGDVEHRERRLLARADLVFTDGSRLAESKARLHDHVHFFGCGVDADHFARARDETLEPAPEMRAFGAPVLGYVGMIDERLDFGLVAHLAASIPEATVVMIGPVVQIDAAALPQSPNLHWLGPRRYDSLPSYLRRVDVCLMPYALNRATEFINPVKALEYMATGRPIVSTPVADVVRNFAPIVTIADGPDAFVRAVRAALANPDDALRRLGIERTRHASWDGIVARMSALIDQTGASRSQRAPVLPPPPFARAYGTRTARR